MQVHSAHPTSTLHDVAGPVAQSGRFARAAQVTLQVLV